MRSALEKVPGVKRAVVSLDSEEAVVQFDKTVATPEQMIKAVQEEGYGASIKKGPTAVIPVDTAAAKGAEPQKPKVKPELGLKELEGKLIKKPYKGEESKVWVELTLVTPAYLRALSTSVAELDSLQKQYRLQTTIPFRVKIETHTVNTLDYDVAAMSVFMDDKGVQYKATGWKELPSPMPMMASHHRLGILFFPKVDEKGKPVIGKQTGWVEVRMKNLGEVKERRFRWELPLEGKD